VAATNVDELGKLGYKRRRTSSHASFKFVRRVKFLSPTRQKSAAEMVEPDTHGGLPNHTLGRDCQGS
jgi:hypothetical protein